MQCLEKDPDARPQRAADIARVLDAVTSGSTASMPSIALGGPGALRRGADHVRRRASRRSRSSRRRRRSSFGLPDWVMPASLASDGARASDLSRHRVRAARRSPGGARHAAADARRRRGAAVDDVRRSRLRPVHISRGVDAADHGRVGDSAASRCSSSCSWRFGRSARPARIADGERASCTIATRFSSPISRSNGADTHARRSVVAEAVRADLGQSPVVSVFTPQAVAAAIAAHAATDHGARRHRRWRGRSRRREGVKADRRRRRALARQRRIRRHDAAS